MVSAMPPFAQFAKVRPTLPKWLHNWYLGKPLKFQHSKIIG